MEPQKHEILRVSYYGMTGDAGLVKLVEEPFKTLMRVIAHRVLKPIIRHVCLEKRLFHGNGIYHLKKISLIHVNLSKRLGFHNDVLCIVGLEQVPYVP